MMLLCCSLASASFTSRNTLSLSVDRLNSKICTLQSLIYCDPIRSSAPETIYKERPWIEVVPCLLTFFDRYCHLYILCFLRQLSLTADSQKLFSSPQRAHVTFFVKRDKLELAFWLLCSVHAVTQVPPIWVVGSRHVHAVIQVPPDGVVGLPRAQEARKRPARRHSRNGSLELRCKT